MRSFSHIKKKWFVILAIITLILIFILLQSRRNSSKDLVPFTIGGITYQLKVADTREEWERGLMFVFKKNGFDGMLFEFEEAKPRTFWNKNTFVDLTVYWYHGEEQLGKTDLPSIKKSGQVVYISSPGPADKVVEIIETKEE